MLVFLYNYVEFCKMTALCSRCNNDTRPLINSPFKTKLTKFTCCSMALIIANYIVQIKINFTEA